MVGTTISSCKLTAISLHHVEFRSKNLTLFTILRLRKSTSMGRCHWLSFARPRYSTAIPWRSIRSLLTLAARLASPRSPDSWETTRSVSTVPSRRSTPPFRAIRVIPLHLGYWGKLCGISRYVQLWERAAGPIWGYGSKEIIRSPRFFHLQCPFCVFGHQTAGGRVLYHPGFPVA
uniref:Extended-spectrum beta-lactamase n=1 Tax=Escherichia coli TaxID=562 RepID=A0A7I8HMY3_ECOLX|nr:extended-spectrum beta-lactamase [Escherichia coli]